MLLLTDEKTRLVDKQHLKAVQAMACQSVRRGSMVVGYEISPEVLNFGQSDPPSPVGDEFRDGTDSNDKSNSADASGKGQSTQNTTENQNQAQIRKVKLLQMYPQEEMVVG
eukprot:TRINITY_DN13663_c0_g1_i1.p1 TRINITY_DN13663_c0_g1~~TRINITY_DN13663_c0_g1_i1.p1  ORF type:complete len:111 (-),score=16.80 TRINITY_DN13663_c0_g1_i1:225-557(-)